MQHQVMYGRVLSQVTLRLLQLAGAVARGFSLPVPVPTNTDVLSEVDALVTGLLDTGLANALQDATRFVT
jgi:hypothetical protein